MSAIAERGTKMRWVLERMSGVGDAEAGVVDEGVDEGETGVGEALEKLGCVVGALFGPGIGGAEGDSNPEALVARPGEEGACG